MSATETRPAPTRRRINWFAAFWRWHFYGALIVIPVLFMLSISGLTYLYRAQVDALVYPGVLTVAVPDGAERAPLADQEAAVRDAYPEREILSVTDNSGDRATEFVTAVGDGTRSVYVDPYRTEVTGDLAASDLVSEWAITLHGTLFVGDLGDRIIELGASWAIVLTITGFIIFFLGRRPRAGALAKKSPGARLRFSHAIAGVPVGLGILMLVVSGLPWTGIWGSIAQNLASQNQSTLWSDDPGATSTVKEQLERADGTDGPVGWTATDIPSAQSSGVVGTTISVDRAAQAARSQGAPEPYFITYPTDDAGVFSVYSYEWANNGNVAESDVTQAETIHVDQYSGEIVARYGYGDYSPLAQAVSQGIALHEGRRFGPVNMILTTLFCLAVMFLCVSAPIMWWTRRGTASGLAAPRAQLPVFGNWLLLVAIVALGVFLPLFGLSVVVVLAIDWLLIRRVPAMKKFFGTV